VQLGRSETLARLDEIKTLIQQKDKALFHQNCQFAEQTFSIQAIEFEGLNQISPAVIEQQLDLPAITGNELTGFDIRNLLAEVYSLGYFKDVQGSIIHEVRQPRLVIQVEENPFIKNIIFSGNSVFADSVLNLIFENAVGKVFNHRESQQMLIRLIKLYRENGYPLAQVNSVNLEPNGTLILNLQEGKIAKIEIEGNETTQNHVILRELPLQVGNILNYEKVQQAIQNIYSTGLFNTVRLNIIQKGHYPELLIKVNEKKFNLVRIGGHYSSDRKGRGFIEFLNQNIFGTGNSLTLHVQSGDRDQKLALQFRADRIFKSYLTTKFNLYYQQQKYFSYLRFQKQGEYAETRSGFDFSFGQQIQRLGTVSVEGKYNQINLENRWGTNLFSGEIEVNTLALRSIVDTRDQNPFPMSGKYYHFFYEFSSATILASDISYFKLFSSLENYKTWFEWHTLHPKVMWGTSDLTTPDAEWFYLGEKNSFSGLKERQLRGRYLMQASLEYRLKVPKKLPFDTYLHCQADLAGIWEKEVDIKAKDFLLGLGIKFSVNTPLGPFSLAYGRTRNRLQRFYISAGFDF